MGHISYQFHSINFISSLLFHSFDLILSNSFHHTNSFYFISFYQVHFINYQIHFCQFNFINFTYQFYLISLSIIFHPFDNNNFTLSILFYKFHLSILFHFVKIHMKKYWHQANFPTRIWYNSIQPHLNYYLGSCILVWHSNKLAVLDYPI